MFQFYSSKLCIVHTINMEGTVSQNFDIRIRLKNISLKLDNKNSLSRFPPRGIDL